MLAFSGGVDSALVAAALCDAHRLVLTQIDGELLHPPCAVTFFHPFTPRAEIEHAQRVAAQIDIEHRVISHGLLDDALKTNPIDRCYICKTSLFTAARAQADYLGYQHIVDGTQTDDAQGYRPGMRALEELGVISPLRMAGFTKAQVRTCAQDLGLTVAHRPSLPCMATRFPYDTPLDFDLFEPLFEAEQELLAQQISPVRLRVHREVLRIELGKQHFVWALDHADYLSDIGRRLGFAHTCLDLMPHTSGSMDIARGLLSRPSKNLSDRGGSNEAC